MYTYGGIELVNNGLVKNFVLFLFTFDFCFENEYGYNVPFTYSHGEGPKSGGPPTV